VWRKRRRKRKMPRDFMPYEAMIFQRRERRPCTGSFYGRAAGFSRKTLP
jgi:hypothetical protein